MTSGTFQLLKAVIIVLMFFSDLAKKEGFKVNPRFIGHGIGRYFHGPPDILHSGRLVATILSKLVLYSKLKLTINFHFFIFL